MKRTEWFNRRFPAIVDNGLLPGIIERIEGTPARLQFKLNGLQEDLVGNDDHPWSAKMEVGHLADLEPLWYERMKQIQSGAPELMIADLTNRKTFEAGHNRFGFAQLIEAFRKEREKFVVLLRSLSDEELENESLHPRLKTPMRAIDLAFFVAEHDDHHLAHIQELIIFHHK